VILILRPPHDGEAGQVARRLDERGIEYLWYDPGSFPARSELSLGLPGGGDAGVVLRVEGREYDLSRVTAAWHFCRATPAWGFTPTIPTAHEEITDEPVRTAVERESRSFLEDAWRALNCLWVPGTADALHRAEQKVTQLRLAVELGFEIPPTLITNSPKDFLGFYRAHDGKIIGKAVQRALIECGSAGGFAFAGTEPVSPRDLGHAHSIRYMPVIFQAYVPKRVELRVTAVGREVFPAEIDSQRTRHTQHDWRRYDAAATPYQPHDLPGDVRQRCLRMLERLELCYGSFDLVLTPDGRYVFLEINPAGRYGMIERKTGLPITAAVCDLLSGTA
jgi:hypothetical protein